MSSFQGTKINPTRFDKSQIKFYVILIVMSSVMVLPLIYIFSQAFKPIDELFAYPPKFFVKNPSFANFSNLIAMMGTSEVPIARYFFNSIISTVLTIVFSLTISAMAGYALAKKKFRAKDTVFDINTAALMFVPTAVMIPKYLIISGMQLNTSFWVHIIPALALPVGLFLVKQFMEQIPDALIEAAKLDGASELSIFFNIIIPLSKAPLSTVAILTFQSAWNATEASSLYLADESLKNFAFYMTTLTTTGNDVVGQGMAAAATLIMFIPNLVIFVVMQKQVMDTMAHSGIK